MGITEKLANAKETNWVSEEVSDFELCFNQKEYAQLNKESVAALVEAKRIAKDPTEIGYRDVDQLFVDLEK